MAKGIFASYAKRDNRGRYISGSGITIRGKLECIDCGKKLNNWFAEKCKSCVFKGHKQSNTGRTHFKKGQTGWSKGKKRPEFAGKNHPNWKGGITPINRAIRNSLEYEEWRKACMERDNYSCQECGNIGGYLEVDHIKPFAYFPELRFITNNGRTLCKGCHNKTNTYGGRAKKIYAY